MKKYSAFTRAILLCFLSLVFASGIYGQTSCIDSDNDGVPDQWDLCPNTSPGSYVDRNGCPAIGLYSEEQVNKMVKNILAWGDIDGDNKIGLSEVIYALRVVSGLTEPSIINGTILLADNFDSAMTGQVPPGWSAIHNGDGQCTVTSSESYSSSNSFRIGCLQSWDGVYTRPVTMSGNIIVASIRFKGDPNTWFRPYFDITVASKTYGGSYDPTSGKMGWICNTAASTPIIKNVWYTAKIQVDKASGLASYYLNGVLVASSCQGITPFSTRPNENVTLASGNGGNGVIYYDDISVISY